MVGYTGFLMNCLAVSGVCRQLGRAWKPVKLLRRLGFSGVIFAACLLLGLIAVLLVVMA